MCSDFVISSDFSVGAVMCAYSTRLDNASLGFRDRDDICVVNIE
jgi:hypothetical protein